MNTFFFWITKSPFCIILRIADTRLEWKNIICLIWKPCIAYSTSKSKSRVSFALCTQQFQFLDSQLWGKFTLREKKYFFCVLWSERRRVFCVEQQKNYRQRAAEYIRHILSQQTKIFFISSLAHNILFFYPTLFQTADGLLHSFSFFSTSNFFFFHFHQLNLCFYEFSFSTHRKIVFFFAVRKTKWREFNAFLCITKRKNLKKIRVSSISHSTIMNAQALRAKFFYIFLSEIDFWTFFFLVGSFSLPSQLIIKTFHFFFRLKIFSRQ